MINLELGHYRSKMHKEMAEKSGWVEFEDRPFKCSFCEKSFKYVKALITHERVHKETLMFKAKLLH